MTQAASENMEFFPGATEVVPKPKTARKKTKEIDAEHLPPNLAKAVKVRVPDFSDPKRPKTCLEVDFPIVPINALTSWPRMSASFEDGDNSGRHWNAKVASDGELPSGS